MRRYYLADVVKIEDPDLGEYWTSAVDAIDPQANYVQVIPTDPLTGLPTVTHCLVLVSGNRHGRLIADGRCVPLPDFPLDGKMNAMRADTRDKMAGDLRQRGFQAVADAITSADGYRDVIRGIGRTLNPHFDENSFDVSE